MERQMSEAAVGMRCQELVEVITDYLEGAMAPEDVERFDEHISLCHGCEIYLDQMRTTIAALGHIPTESIDAEAQQRLLHAFRDWSYGR
jgi:anti-sigma factor RsiW